MSPSTIQQHRIPYSPSFSTREFRIHRVFITKYFPLSAQGRNEAGSTGVNGSAAGSTETENEETGSTTSSYVG